MGSGSAKMTPLKVDIRNQVLDSIKKAAQSTASDISTGSPRRNGVYEKGWTHDIIDEVAIVHNNGKEKSISHLLENGHASFCTLKI